LWIHNWGKNTFISGNQNMSCGVCSFSQINKIQTGEMRIEAAVTQKRVIDSIHQHNRVQAFSLAGALGAIRRVSHCSAALID